MRAISVHPAPRSTRNFQFFLKLPNRPSFRSPEVLRTRGSGDRKTIALRGTFHTSHIRCRTTATPRTDGLFGFNPACDFATLRIRDNLIECEGQPRPLLRAPESYRTGIENNRLTNVADTAKFANPPADRPVGPEEPVAFECGSKGEFQVNGWEVREEKP